MAATMPDDAFDALIRIVGENPIGRTLAGILAPGLDPALTATVDRHRNKKFAQWAAELNDNPDVTPEQIAEDDKLFAVFAVANCVSRAHSKERVSYFARLHASFLAGRLSSPDEFDEFMHLLDSLSEREFTILLRLRELADNTQGVRLGSRELLFQSQAAWKNARAGLAHNVGLDEAELDSIVLGLTRTGFVRILLEPNGSLTGACATERLETFLMALTKYDRHGPPRRPTISVRSIVG
jgi:hypothetical protein